MGKTMAFLEDNVVTGLWWCSDKEPGSETLIDITDRPVQVGDIYTDGKFYRDGKVILTEMEDMQEALNILGVSE